MTTDWQQTGRSLRLLGEGPHLPGLPQQVAQLSHSLHTPHLQLPGTHQLHQELKLLPHHSHQLPVCCVANEPQQV